MKTLNGRISLNTCRRAKITPFSSSIYSLAGGEGGGGEYGDVGVGGGQERGVRNFEFFEFSFLLSLVLFTVFGDRPLSSLKVN